MGDIDKLIELVKQYPFLYDTSHIEYSNTKMKSNTWEIIAAKANFPTGAAAKAEWDALRNRHREALRRQKSKIISNSGGAIKLWRYQIEMQFLVPYMKTSLPRTGLDLSSFGDSIVTNMYEKEEVDDEDIDGAEYECGDNDLRYNTKKLKTQHDIQPDVNFADKSTNVCLDTQKDFPTLTQKIRHDDAALYHFFISMYNSTKNMPKNVQCTIKKKFSSIVFEEEEKMLNEMERKSNTLTDSQPHSTELQEHTINTLETSSEINNLTNSQPSSSENILEDFSPFVEKYEPL